MASPQKWKTAATALLGTVSALRLSMMKDVAIILALLTVVAIGTLGTWVDLHLPE